MSYQQVILDDGPLCYYRMGDTSGTVARDVQGADNGSYTQAVGTLGVASVPGLIVGDRDTAVSLSNGKSVALGTPPVLQINTGTLECWFSTTVINNSAYLALVGKNGAWWLGRLNSNKLGLFDYGGGANRDSGVAINDGKIHHVVLAFQSGVANGTKLYLDAGLILTTTMTVSFQTNGAGIAQNGTGAQVITATIDEVAIYGYPLSQAQVARHYLAGTAPPAWGSPLLPGSDRTGRCIAPLGPARRDALVVPPAVGARAFGSRSNALVIPPAVGARIR